MFAIIKFAPHSFCLILDSNTILGFSINSLDVSEGDGLLNNTLYIEVEGVAEPTLHINISTDGGTAYYTIVILYVLM